MSAPRSLFSKVWEAHVVAQEPRFPALLYVDLHLLHEVTSPQAFAGLRIRGLRVRRPEATIATMDHATPTLTGGMESLDRKAAAQLEQLEQNCREFGIKLYGMDSDRRGIVHVIGPELGLTQPGMTIVCGDSHTSTHGAFGALAFGIGTSEVEHVLATQCTLQAAPKLAEVRIDGRLQRGVTAKDIILGLISQIGVRGGTGYAFEYAGSAIESLDMDGRMTLCNMTIETGARVGMIAPDNTTFEYLAGRDHAPRGRDWDRSLERWRGLATDDGASFDHRVALDAAALEPMITYGTSPEMAIPITRPIPDPHQVGAADKRAALQKSLAYMDLKPGAPLLGHPIDVIFLGSCTNSRISDLRSAAALLGGRRIAQGVSMLVVPGSQAVKRQAEAEGLDEVFLQAGAEWREPGCSMCIAMNGDRLQPGQYAVSTSNRNFEGRQGPGGRTFLASPLTAAATAIMGRVTDPREFL